MADKKTPTRNPKTGRLTLPAVGGKRKPAAKKTSAREIGRKANEQFKAGAKATTKVNKEAAKNFGLPAHTPISEKQYVKSHHKFYKGALPSTVEKEKQHLKKGGSYMYNRKAYARQTGV